MKAFLEFTLPEERKQFDTAISASQNADKYPLAIKEAMREIRKQIEVHKEGKFQYNWGAKTPGEHYLDAYGLALSILVGCTDVALPQD